VKRLLVVAMLVLAGCGTGPAAGQGAHGPTANLPAGQGYRLFVEHGYSPSLQVVTTIRATPVALPDGFLAGDGRLLYTSGALHVYSAAAKTGTTTVNAYDSHTGVLTRKIEVPGDWKSTAGGTSPDGRRLVFSGIHLASGTTFAVLDSSLNSVPRIVDLPGSFDFDAISNDGKRLFLIENLADGSYRVRLVDVPSGTLQIDPVFVKGPEVEAMNGVKITSVADVQGGWLYSLYGRNNGRPPFVHALDLNHAVAYCIDLPAVAGITSYLDSESAGWSLSLDANRQRLYAASARGQVAVIDTAGFGVLRSGLVTAPAAAGFLPRLITDAAAKAYDQSLPGGSAVDAGGGTLYVAREHGFLAVDTGTLASSALRDDADVLSSLALSPDGLHLFAVSRTRSMVIDLDPRTGSQQAMVLAGEGLWRIAHLEPI
jgi:DNA-binding beta-propeller fold protein YncE